MFDFKFFYLSTYMFFWKIEIERNIAKGFKNKIYRCDSKSFELTHFLKNRYL